MSPTDIREHLDERPFEPFRIFMSDGGTYDVQHPDMCMVSRSKLYVGIPDPKQRGVAMRVAHCALIHVTRIEPLNRESKPKPRKRDRS